MKGLVGTGVLLLLLSGGTWSYAADPDLPGGRTFDHWVVFAILSIDPVSFYVPSAIIRDERGKLNPLVLIVTNNTQKEHGFAMDPVKIKEVLKPGESKTFTLSQTDLDALGTDRSTFKYYCHLHKGHIGGQVYIKR